MEKEREERMRKKLKIIHGHFVLGTVLLISWTLPHIIQHQQPYTIGSIIHLLQLEGTEAQRDLITKVMQLASKPQN